MTAVDKSTQKEVEMFLIAIQKNPPIMNLDQYADINRGLITAVIYDRHSVLANYFWMKSFNFRMSVSWLLI